MGSSRKGEVGPDSKTRGIRKVDSREAIELEGEPEEDLEGEEEAEKEDQMHHKEEFKGKIQKLNSLKRTITEKM